jgi:dihydroorotate dehydrogenase
MGFYDTVVRPLAFRFDAEAVHETVMRLIATGVFQGPRFKSPLLEQTLFGVKFPNPLGLAAGFDKNAQAIEQWEGLGFGFVEAGTVTFHPQPGNPKPRLFRLTSEHALINRMGFNNAGAAVVAARLAASSARIPVGINLGKSRVTPLEEAASDYGRSYRLLHGLGDYFAVNVSSPNTPGLRTLQERGPLLEILAALRAEDATRPLFVKVDPDLDFSALDEVIEVAHEAKLTGLIATNTSLGRAGLAADPGIEGGLSGRPLWEASNKFLAHLHASCNPEIVLIGVGGIFTGRDLFDKIAFGAHLCQIYTGWVYGGPTLIPRILGELVTLMNERGIRSLQELRGRA